MRNRRFVRLSVACAVDRPLAAAKDALLFRHEDHKGFH
jgi:hypothetical protein